MPRRSMCHIRQETTGQVTRYKVRPSALKLFIMIVAVQFTRHIHDVLFQNETRTNTKEGAGSNTVDRNSYSEAFSVSLRLLFSKKDETTIGVRLKLVQTEVCAAAEDGGSSCKHSWGILSSVEGLKGALKPFPSQFTLFAAYW